MNGYKRCGEILGKISHVMALPVNMASASTSAAAANVNTNLKLNFPQNKQTLPFDSTTRLYCVKPVQCTPAQVDSGIICESCNDRGWLLCDFCKGQKTNVKAADSNRIYRRCPACKSIGSILCSKCKVFRCVTFPDHNDGEELNF